NDKLRRIGQKISEGLGEENGKRRHRWQAGIALLSMALFVVASVAVNQVVLALNQAAGIYGYRSGSYGYQGATATSSDQVPSAPTAFSAGTPGTSSATIGWTAPTTTTASTAISTGGGSISSYKFHYSTSSLSSCSGGTSSTETSASKTLSSLSSSTTYYVAICATDNNSNDSSALTGSFATAAAAGGGSGSSGGGGGSSIFTAPAATPATPAVPGVAPAVPATPPATASDAATLVAHLVTQGIAVTRNVAAEGTNATRISSSATEFSITIVAAVRTIASNFVTYGTSSVTVALGSGERLAVIRDLFDTLGSVVQGDSSKLLLAAEQISSGQKPTVRNLAKERAQVNAALPAFRKLTGRNAPNFKNAKDDLAWNTMLYRVRFARNLAKERGGITKFKATFKKTPKTPADWAVVRAWAYALQ
ncbi:MAG: hypothetical protein Q8R16_01830, partial [bacterium]|nr:hypothetical protein [bacterium]